jgi:hypothetical protein
LITTGYALPIALLNPYVAGGLFADYVMHGRYHLIPKDPRKLMPDDLAVLTVSGAGTENAVTASEQVHSVAAANADIDGFSPATVNSDLKETVDAHE